MPPDSSHKFPPSGFETWIAFLAERRLLLPTLLFLTGHRPFAFVAGQCLLFCLPFGMILWPGLPLRAWADLLSHPCGPALLRARLQSCLEQPQAGEPPTPEQSPGEHR